MLKITQLSHGYQQQTGAHALLFCTRWLVHTSFSKKKIRVYKHTHTQNINKTKSEIQIRNKVTINENQ